MCAADGQSSLSLRANEIAEMHSDLHLNLQPSAVNAEKEPNHSHVVHIHLRLKWGKYITNKRKALGEYGILSNHNNKITSRFFLHKNGLK